MQPPPHHEEFAACKAKPVTYVVKSNWMHGVFAGEYVEAGRRNGKPKYKQRDGPCVMFHEGSLGATKHGSVEGCTSAAEGEYHGLRLGGGASVLTLCYRWLSAGYELKLPYGEGAPGWKIGFEDRPNSFALFGSRVAYHGNNASTGSRVISVVPVHLVPFSVPQCVSFVELQGCVVGDGALAFFIGLRAKTIGDGALTKKPANAHWLH